MWQQGVSVCALVLALLRQGGGQSSGPQGGLSWQAGCRGAGVTTGSPRDRWAQTRHGSLRWQCPSAGGVWAREGDQERELCWGALQPWVRHGPAPPGCPLPVLTSSSRPELLGRLTGWRPAMPPSARQRSVASLSDSCACRLASRTACLVTQLKWAEWQLSKGKPILPPL